MELLGFDMNALPFGFVHRLMRPVGVRLCNVLEPDNDGDPVFVDGDEAICIGDWRCPVGSGCSFGRSD
jgi:hypothetical protein